MNPINIEIDSISNLAIEVAKRVIDQNENTPKITDIITSPEIYIPFILFIILIIITIIIRSSFYKK